MASNPVAKASLSHLERTAQEPRDDQLHKLVLSRVVRVNEDVKLFWLTPVQGEPRIKFRPGQWLDVYVPGIPKAGGFTITSSPFSLSHATKPHLELAIQRSPSNPPAAWFWRPRDEILDMELEVRVGGSFVWPPLLPVAEIKRVVFVAGGAGINPIISMLNYLAEVHKLRHDLGFRITLLYTTRDLGVANPTEILYLKRLDQIFQILGGNSEMKLFLTSRDRVPKDRVAVDDMISYNSGAPISVQRRRITEVDLLDALGPVEERSKTVCYVCGFPSMTDEFVEKAQQAEGMDRENVLFEKWW